MFWGISCWSLPVCRGAGGAGTGERDDKQDYDIHSLLVNQKSIKPG